MSFGGSVDTMNKMIKNNRKLIGNRRNIYELKDLFKISSKSKRSKKLIIYKEMTPEEKLIFRKKLKKQRLINDYLTALIIILLVVSGIFLYNFIF